MKALLHIQKILNQPDKNSLPNTVKTYIELFNAVVTSLDAGSSVLDKVNAFVMSLPKAEQDSLDPDLLIRARKCLVREFEAILLPPSPAFSKQWGDEHMAFDAAKDNKKFVQEVQRQMGILRGDLSAEDPTLQFIREIQRFMDQRL